MLDRILEKKSPWITSLDGGLLQQTYSPQEQGLCLVIFTPWPQSKHYMERPPNPGG